MTNIANKGTITGRFSSTRPNFIEVQPDAQGNLDLDGYRIKPDGSVWDICETMYCDAVHKTYHFKRKFADMATAIKWVRANA